MFLPLRKYKSVTLLEVSTKRLLNNQFAGFMSTAKFILVFIKVYQSRDLDSELDHFDKARNVLFLLHPHRTVVLNLVILSTGGYLAISGDVFGCHNLAGRATDV